MMRRWKRLGSRPAAGPFRSRLRALGDVSFAYEHTDTLRLQGDVDSAGIVSRQSRPDAVALEHADDQFSYVSAADHSRDDCRDSSVAQRHFFHSRIRVRVSLR